MTDDRPDPPTAGAAGEGAGGGHSRGHDHTHGHSHGHPPAGPMSRRAMRFAVMVLAGAAVLTLIGMVWLWPRGDTPGAADSGGQTGAQVSGEVLTVVRTACPQPSPDDPAGDSSDPAQPGGLPGGQQVECGTVTVRISGGADRGRQVRTELPSGPGAPKVGPGDHVTLIYTPDSPADLQYQIIDHERGRQLWFLVLAFALAVIAFGRWRGLAALAGLGVTFAVLLLFIVPAILDGRSPLLVAIVGSAAIMLSVLYLTHGFTVPTSVAVLGTLTSLTLTGLLSAAATSALHLTGVASEEDNFLTITNQSVNMQGLLLAGILIGSLGVLDDVAVTQSVAVHELAQANPALSAVGLYRAGSRVGRAHITSVINTIILAYAGASLPLLLLIAAGNQPLGQVLTTQLMAQELVRSIVGTLGLIAAVPITTALAALAARRPTHGSRPRPPLGRGAVPGPRGARHGTASRQPSTFAARTRASGWLDGDTTR